jgi:hypothetical protein
MKHSALFIAFIMFGALVGSVLGEIIGGFLGEGLMYNILSKGIFIGFDPTSINLQVIIFTLGFSIKFNLLSALGAVMGGYAYRKL